MILSLKLIRSREQNSEKFNMSVAMAVLVRSHVKQDVQSLLAYFFESCYVHRFVRISYLVGFWYRSLSWFN